MGAKPWIFALLLAIVRSQSFKMLGHADHLSSSLHKSSPDLNDLSRIIETSFPFYKGFCAGQALKDFLPQCMQHGIETIDPKLRVQAAVKLSFCEFEESGLEMKPKSCTDSSFNGIKECVDEMKSSPQWWTTYSGNYQRLSTLCYENSLPFEKEQLLALFLNITDVYSTFNEMLEAHLTDKFKILENLTTSNIQKFQEAFEKQVEAMGQTYSDNLESFLHKFEQFEDEAFSGLNDSVVAVQTQVLDVETDLWLELKTLKQYIEKINIELNTDDYEEQIRLLKDTSLEQLQTVAENAEAASLNSISQLREVNAVLDRFSSKSSDNLYKLDEDVNNSYMDIIVAFQDFKNLIQNSMIPLVQDEMGPHLEQFSQKLLADLQEIDNVVINKTNSWSDNLDSTFGIINTNLNRTVASVRQLDISLESFKLELGNFMSALRLIKGSLSMVIAPISHLFGSFSATTRSLIVMFLLRAISIVGNYMPSLTTTRMSLLGGCLPILGALVSGSLFGFYSFS
ncbi:LANO_0E13234g1_1 [Lachancea nothofagi CBS 11611]|uniref:Nuclear fusion protein KAR5 n=1 Tax=Lachancea nothofagi CBS 11611 TaxID=1266666 RepID=A0A1G4JYT7_9SACH|nr:LANO_0E13234g1_1 [Lachancea nothofagi CBS 11611]